MPGATLVYDDDCGFCTWWARFVERRSDLRLVGFSELEGDGPGVDEELRAIRARLPDDFEECSHLLTDEDVYSCGASIEEAIVRARVCGLDLADPVGFLRHFRDYNRLREGTYRWVAEHRGLLGKVFRATPPARESDGDDGRSPGEDE